MDNHPLTCLCTPCVDYQRIRLIKEPHTIYPDCSECYLSYNFLSKDYTNMTCEYHRLLTVSRRSEPTKVEYAFTLTMPPDYKPKKPIEEAARLIMEHGQTSKPAQFASHWAIVLEHTDAGTPHVHGVYTTSSGRRIAAKYFKRYWDLWDEKVHLGHGHQGGYHQKARHAQSYAAYIEKEGVVVKSQPDLISHA